MCTFEPKFYADKLVPIAAITAKSNADDDAKLICAP